MIDDTNHLVTNNELRRALNLRAEEMLATCRNQNRIEICLHPMWMIDMCIQASAADFLITCIIQLLMKRNGMLTRT